MGTAGRIPTTLPALLMHGEDDPLGQFGQGVRRAARQVLYPGMRHKILPEAGKQPVHQDVATWLSCPSREQTNGAEALDSINRAGGVQLRLTALLGGPARLAHPTERY